MKWVGNVIGVMIPQEKSSTPVAKVMAPDFEEKAVGGSAVQVAVPVTIDGGGIS